MNIQYQNDLEASLYYANLRSEELKKKMTEKDLEIQELKRKVKQLEEQKNYILDIIDKECIWDEHEWGYIKDFPKSKIRNLMMNFDKRKPLKLNNEE